MNDIPGGGIVGLVVLYLILDALRSRAGRGAVWMMLKGVCMIYLLLVPTIVVILLVGRSGLFAEAPLMAYLGSIVIGVWITLKLIDWREKNSAAND